MRTRVLLVALTPILRRFVEQAVEGRPDIELIGSCDARDATDAIAAQQPDVVIVPAPELLPGSAYEAAMWSLPRTRLLEIGGDSNRFVLRQLAMNPGTGELLGAIRGATSVPTRSTHE